MRNTIKTIAALLIVLGAAKSQASVDSTYVGSFCKVVAQEKEDNFKLIYKGSVESPIVVKWIDKNDQIVYKENIQSTDAFVKQYNLSTLPDGRYLVAVTAADYSFTEEVVLGDLAGMKFNFRSVDNKHVVMTGYKPEDKDVKLYVLDEDRNELYTERFTEGSVVQKKFNFENTKTESVTFVLSHRGKIINEETIRF